MVPAAVVDQTIADLLTHLAPGDILIDDGNSYYVDDIQRAKNLAAKDILFVDVGTSGGGVWGLERGYCMMIGGEKEVVQHLDPIFSALAPGIGDIPRTRGRRSSKALLSKAICTAAKMEQATLSRWCTMESNTESWRPTPKECPWCAQQTLANNSTVLMPKPLRYAIRNTTRTTSICETWPKYGGGEV